MKSFKIIHETRTETELENRNKAGNGTTSVWYKGGRRHVEGYWGPLTCFFGFRDLSRFHIVRLCFVVKNWEKTIVLDHAKF